MSTKVTIGFNKSKDGVSYHLYSECFDDLNVYLELSNLSDFDFDFFDKNITVRLAIPKEVMKSIYKDLKKDHMVKTNGGGGEDG